MLFLEECAYPVWNRSNHAKKVDIILNETCQHSTEQQALPAHRCAAKYTEKFKQTTIRNTLYGTCVTHGRLRSRRNFLRMVGEEPPENYPLRQENPGGVDLDWRTWQTLNRIRTGVAAVKTNKIRWNQIDHQDTFCDCGEVQDMAHLTSCRNCPNTC